MGTTQPKRRSPARQSISSAVLGHARKVKVKDAKKKLGASNRGTDNLRLGGGRGVPNEGTVSVFSQNRRWLCCLCAIQSMNVFSQRAPTSTSRLFGDVSGQCVLFKCVQSRSGRPTKCFKRFHQVPMWSLAGCFGASGSFVLCACQLHCCTWACVCLKSLHLCVSLGGGTALRSSSTVASSTTAASASEEERLHAALFLTVSASTTAKSLCTSEDKDCTGFFFFTKSACTSEKKERPSSSQNWRVPRRRMNWFFFHSVGLYFGGGILPRNVCEYMQLVLRCVLSMSASRGVQALRIRLCWGLEENSSGASWGEGVAVGPRFHSPRKRPLEGLSIQEFQVAGRCRQS